MAAGQVRCITIAILALWASSARAMGPFDGFWGVIGAKTVSDNNSVSTVSYDYKDRYAGSLYPPGFTIRSDYELIGPGPKILPAAKLLYITSLGKSYLGFSISADQPAMDLTTEKFDFMTPSNAPDRAQGYTTKSKIRPAYDAAISIEPGANVSNGLMIFLRVGYHAMRAHVATASSVETGLINPVFTEVLSTAMFQGYEYGGGFRYLYTPRLFLEVAYARVEFEKKNVPGSTLVSSADEITMTQTQSMKLAWGAASLLLGVKF